MTTDRRSAAGSRWAASAETAQAPRGQAATAPGAEGVPAWRPAPPVRDVRTVKVRPGHHVELPDQVATEEPLEVRVEGPGQRSEAVAVTMRTPGHDFELAAGFLLTEGLITAAEVTAVGYCSDAEPEHRFNTVSVAIDRPWTGTTTRRDFVATSSCGVCGKAGIDQVELDCPPLPPPLRPLPASLLPLLPDRLRAAQRTFDRTGGLHAAGAFAVGGTLLCAREDVGRHNAVDKVVGHLALAAGRERNPGPSDVAVLMVSGRVSFEIVQKAAMASFPVIAAVSAPSSLAVEAADRLGVALAGFVRGDSYRIYTHPDRFDLDA